MGPNLPLIFQDFTNLSSREGPLPQGARKPMPFLLKSEPTTYSFDDLERDGKTVWDGISNPQALLNLRSMKPGEKLVIYHSGTGKAAIGTAKVLSVDAADPKNPKVVIEPGKRLKHEKTLAEMRDASVF